MRSAPGGSVSTTPASRRNPLLGISAGLSLFLLEPAAFAQLRPPAATPPIWTQVPTRIDRSKDTRERVEIPAPPPGFVVAGDARTDAAGRLIIGGRSHRLVGLVPIEPDRLCSTADGRRWACGVRARAQLSGLVIGKTLRCHHVGDPAAAEPVVDCRVRERSVTESMISAGLGDLDAEGAAIAHLATAREAARRARIGIWSALPPP